jgi:sphinganine-1-phosphate aldolase
MIPSVKNKLERELGKAAKDIEDKVAPQDDNFPRYTVLPERGFSEELMTKELER